MYSNIVIALLLLCMCLQTGAQAGQHQGSDRSQPVQAILNINSEVTSFEYVISIPPGERLESFSVDIGLPEYNSKYLELNARDLPYGECSIDPMKSNLYAMSLSFSRINGGIQTILKPVIVLESDQQDSTNKARAASWVSNLKNNHELANLIDDINKDALFKGNDGIGNQKELLSEIKKKAKKVSDAYSVITSSVVDNTSISKLELIVETLVSSVKELDASVRIMKEFSWDQYKRYPASIKRTYSLNGSLSNNILDCEFVNEKEAVWYNTKGVQDDILRLALDSHGVPVLRQYDLITKDIKSDQLLSYTGLTIGPGLSKPVDSVKQSILAAVNMIHVSYHEGWLKNSGIANKLIATLENALSEYSSGNIYSAHQIISKSLNDVYKIHCENNNKCNDGTIRTEGYSILNVTLTSLSSMLRSTNANTL
jgi:hypothetical protein